MTMTVFLEFFPGDHDDSVYVVAIAAIELKKIGLNIFL